MSITQSPDAATAAASGAGAGALSPAGGPAAGRAPLATADPSRPDHTAVHRRVSRRETHSPRSLLAILLAVVLVVVFAWIGTEIALSLFGFGALLVAPADMFTSVLNLPALPVAVLAAAGIVVAVVGVLLVIAAVSPGRRPRHTLASERSAVVIDNEVIASALARHASLAADVDPDNVTVSVSHRLAEVRLVPSAGRPIDRAAVQTEVEKHLAAYDLRPRLRARVRVTEQSKVGA
ncbi:DUF6286 domain-containing protein [Herbiconiux sp.]|uniref:DUF6286 domain-containing protein n=1 Tax=Herbiconiux sp. TaxID=1871186 RepID=UPI0025C3C5B4|nr:DUF6286 domain-containing protein [Herbiconiux sp.]